MNVVTPQSVRSFIDESLFFEEFGGEKPKTSWLKLTTGLRKKVRPKSSVVTEILGRAASGFSGVNVAPGDDALVVRTGVVLLAHTTGAWAVYGWKNELSDPRCEAPGTVAVDVLGNIWQATGGNEYEGAEAWEVLRTAA
jgi:hypothetical protein